ncbi:hypothetical protein LCGC14_0297470 [marine sediment metagenome]|uniref:Uncharacterized protein n=1 Tax=marine sediment metagenome TaxID=412755 RepID=A0A0F9TW06_9ZZZZ
MTDLTRTAGAMCDRIETMTGNATANVALAHLNRGYVRLLGGIDPRDPLGDAHVWSFLRPKDTMTWWTTTTTGVGTITTNTTLTVAAATFYPSMVGATITSVTLETAYTISAYTSSKVVTLSADASADNGDTFTIAATGTYQLPDDFGGMVDDFVFDYSSAGPLHDLEEVSLARIDELQRNDSGTGESQYWAIMPRSLVLTASQKYDVIVYPTPSTTWTIRYRYQVLATVLTDATTVYLPGSPLFSQAAECAGLAEAELMTGHVHGVWEGRFAEAMEAAIDEDRSLFNDWDAPVNTSDV